MVNLPPCWYDLSLSEALANHADDGSRLKAEMVSKEQNTMSTTALALPGYFADIDQYTRDASENVTGVRRHARPKWLVTFLTLPLLWPLRALDSSLGQTIRVLNSNALDSLSDKQVRLIAHSITQSNGRLCKLLASAEELGLFGSIFSYYWTAISKKHERMQSIAEGLYMSLDEETVEALRDLITEATGQQTPNGPQQGSLIGCV